MIIYVTLALVVEVKSLLESLFLVDALVEL